MESRNRLRLRPCLDRAGSVVRVAATLSLAVTAPAVQAAPEAAPASRTSRQHATFVHLTIEQGLSDQRVEGLVQDRAGFLWFGTNNGLNRYDGYSVVVYRNDPTNLHTLSHNRINDLLEDRFGTLWVATPSGLNAMDRRTERFTRYLHDPANPRSLSEGAVLTIYEDRSGVLWVGTGGGLNRFDRATGTFTVYRSDPTNPSSLSDANVMAIAEDRTGALWIGTLRGLSRFDRATGQSTVYRHDPRNPRSLSHDVVWDLYEDRSGRLWVGTDGGGLNRFDPTTNDFTRYRHDPDNPDSLSGDRIACIVEDASGALWITTFGAGLNVLDVARQRFTRYRHDPADPTSLSNDYLDKVIVDRSGLIWIATHGSGTNIHDPRRPAFTIYEHDPEVAASLASNNVWVVSEERDGVLWIGTQDRGLDRFDRRRGQVVHYPPDPSTRGRLGHAWVSALQHDREGALWVGTYGGGLYRLDPASGRFTAYRHDPANPRSLSDDTIADLHVDRAGTLWVGTRGGGLNRFDRASGTFTVYRRDADNPASLSSDWAWVIAEDASGSLWIGTFGGGLNRLDPATGHVTRYRHAPQDETSLSDESVWTLHVDRSGVLWVGTAAGGLDRFDRAADRFTHYRERDGLASDRIVSILEDGNAGDPAGNLWIATGRGLSKLDRDRKTFQTYGTTHGLPLTEYNRGGQATRDGELLMTSIDGLIAFNPDAVRNDQDVPQVVFTNFLLANSPAPIGGQSPLRQSIDQTDSITLSYADRVISFEFAALNYRAPHQSRYRYRLDNFDEGWIEVGSTQRLVTYTNLAPGRYVFRVTAANANGIWNENGRAIALIVTPPWWGTWWFRGLALTLIVGCATGFYARRVNSLERRRRALERQVDEQKRVEEVLRANNQQIQDLAGRLITAQEVERARIARELHDDVSQQLAALSISLSALKRKLPANLTTQGSHVVDLQKRATAVVASIRQLSHELHPSVVQHAGLVAALERNCAEFGNLHGMEVVFHADEGLDELPLDVSLCLYRVAQEALHNTAKHAQASRVDVVLTYRDGTVELGIADNGRGFDVREARRRGGLGLTAIDERVRLVAGEVRIEGQVGQGTRLLVRVPRGAGKDTPQERQ